jgi:zinc protease
MNSRSGMTLLLGALALGCAPRATVPPQEPAERATAAVPELPQPARTSPPPLGPVKPLTLPQVVQRELPNGLRLLIVEHHELPVADFVLVVNTGAEADPQGRGGLANLTAALLDDGTRTRSALDIAEQIGFLGIQLAAGSGWDASRVILHTPTAQLDSALALFADVVLNPAFAADELERLRQERLTQLLQLRDRPPAIADLAYNLIVFGDEHPYGRSTIGTESSVEVVTREDLQRFYAAYYRPNNAVLIVVGAVQPDDIVQRVRDAFGGWERATVPRAQLPSPARAPAGTLYLIDKPGAPQSSFRLGGIGVARATEDFFPVLVMNTILGGSFTSRLNANLRETRGYTYGAGSMFDMRRAAGPFVARAEIVATKTDSALIEFMRELRGVHEVVPADELDKAKQYLQLQLPSQFETTADIATRLMPLAVYDLPLDYFDDYTRRIEAVTQQDVQRVARRYVRPDEMSIVIVGDVQTIEQGVRAVHTGPVEVRDVTGRPPQ